MATYPSEIGLAGIGAARNIEAARVACRLTQRQLAERCTALGRPMTNNVVSRTERGRRRCDVDDLVAIANALGVSPLALLRPSSIDFSTAVSDGVAEGV
ncbi:helix-turn-helix domain-containing protein [Streptomyces huasconensis]|nr:helix-turn-helix transcriptional regulator [Streptomyces sp. JCM 35825]UFQ20220.1 helix-turn-helix domain-containing protein [Streptomyces huasconensis]WCL89838.1 helix-turn-helix transcriptional regulator [Streptomyces sp. JCM 35825]